MLQHEILQDLERSGNLAQRALSFSDMSVGTFEAQHDLYAILGVDRNASPSEIRKAHRRLAFLSHPDRIPSGQSLDSPIDLKLVNLAASVLLDPVRRSRYDHLRRSPPQASPQTGRSGAQGSHSGHGRTTPTARPKTPRVAQPDATTAPFSHSAAAPVSVHDGWLVRMCAWAVAATCLLAILNESFAPPRSDPYEEVRRLHRPQHALALHGR